MSEQAFSRALVLRTHEETMAVGKWWRKLVTRVRAALAPGAFLCDSCRYDHPRSCRNPERPNATVCEDYKRR